MSRAEPEIRVLLVDDEAGFRQPVAKRLAKRGLAVDQAGGGPEALALLEKRPADVVVLDVKMPGMDGLTALAKIKEGHPKAEVILLTGQASSQDGVAGIKGGAFDYLTKPVELEHLAGKIRQAFEKILRIEERTREEEFRARMEQQMIATERLASLGTLATGIAHEINNPLAIISESAGWLKSRVAKDDSLSGPLRDNFNLALGKVESSVNRAKRITHQLLGFARKTDSIVREFDLEELAAEVVELTKKGANDAKAGIGIKVETKKTTLWSDPDQVRQVLINLVTNSLQALEHGGKISLVISEDGPEAVVIVKDDGPGIPKENLDRIFEPFFSTKPPGKGTGLGLSVSRGIVEKLGGRIEVESSLGNGAVFRVFLPKRPLIKPGQSDKPAEN